jgi:hypothetical protein
MRPYLISRMRNSCLRNLGMGTLSYVFLWQRVTKILMGMKLFDIEGEAPITTDQGYALDTWFPFPPLGKCRSGEMGKIEAADMR